MPDISVEDIEKATAAIRTVKTYFETGAMTFDAQLEGVVPDNPVIEAAGELMVASGELQVSLGGRLADWASDHESGTGGGGTGGIGSGDGI